MPARKLKGEIELFRSWLRQNRLKKTCQKELILETFLGVEGHLSVEDVYALVKKRDRRVGSVTVFRTLKSLVVCGLAREVTLGDGLTRFEHNYRHPLHHHIVCTRCGRTIEFSSPELERMQDEIIRKYDFQPERHRFDTHGVCSACRENRPVREAAPCDNGRVFARDAVRMALAMEVRLLDFFRSVAAADRDTEGRAVFARMVRLKEVHVADLNAQLEEIIGGERHLETVPVFLHFDLGKIEQKILSLTRAAKGDVRISATAARELARFLSTATADCFKDYATRFPDTQGGQILLIFAGREESHADLLEG
ncbi:MAG: transcriptional repressor [Acidobacteriota bacterium]|jgi:Fur family ferric uptake transcriptional regulator|nr:transcriptional repressor [Acidobacteriota bacterium]